MVVQLVLLVFHQNLDPTLLYPYPNLLASRWPFLSCEIQYSAWRQHCRHQWIQNYPVHLPVDISWKNSGPYAPTHHRRSYHRGDDIYLIHHQQYERIFYTGDSNWTPIRSFQIRFCGVLVLTHLAHQAKPEKL